MRTKRNGTRFRRVVLALPVVAVVTQTQPVGAQMSTPDAPDGGGTAERPVRGTLGFAGNLTDSRGVRQSGRIGVQVHVHPEDQLRFRLTPEASTIKLAPVEADSSGRFSVNVDMSVPRIEKLTALGARLELVLSATTGVEKALAFAPVNAVRSDSGAAARSSAAVAGVQTIDISTSPVASAPESDAGSTFAPVSAAVAAVNPPPGLCTQVGSSVRISDGTVSVAATRMAPGTSNWAIGWNYKRTNTTTTNVGLAFGVGAEFPKGSVTFSASGSSSVGRATSMEGAALTGATGSGIGRKHNITVSRYLTKWSCLISPSIPPPNNVSRAYTIHSGSWVADFSTQEIGSPGACTLTGPANGVRNWTQVGAGSSITRESQSSTTYESGFTGGVSYQGMSANLTLNTTTGFSTNAKVTVANTLTSGNKRLCGYKANRKPLFDDTQFVANAGVF